ncbi:MAG TPA: 4-phosphopantoate--beta-alanine ligase [Nitrososphaera sp.]|nr:4-phosphopantoate--beta-alanine ligase [Nitrososphaera sp.]
MPQRINVPESHPRAKSLYTRELLVDGYRKGLVALEGLVAHGRGEAFDYLIGERTTVEAANAIRAAAAMLLTSKHPVISVNGNVAALCPSQVVRLAESTGSLIEVNLFYRTDEREQAIKAELEIHGARNVLGVGPRASARIPELQSERRRVDPDGIGAADTVLVPLEDGDRTEALVKMGKKVLAIDLNPLSRTAQAAHITIVDNVVRAMPLLLDSVIALKSSTGLQEIVDGFDNSGNLARSLAMIRGGM